MIRVFFLVLTLSSCTGFRYGNDLLIPGGRDRYLTSEARFLFGKYSVGNELYTPTDKENPEIPYGDRPWSAWTFVEREDVDRVGFGEENVLRSRIGGLGDYSFGKEIQQFVHDSLTDLGRPQTHPTWAGQNPAQIGAEVIVSRRTREYLQSAIGDSRLTNEYGIRFGNVVDELFLDQELRKHFWKYLDIFAGITGKVVAFNTHLDGRMFESNVYTVDKQWFVAAGRLGFELKKNDYAFGYQYQYMTEEFEGQEARHLYGTFTFGWKF